MRFGERREQQFHELGVPHALLGSVGTCGYLQTGDAPGGGFCVEAELPAKAPDAMTGTLPERTCQ